MATISPTRATLDDLLRTEGKAELIGGRIVRFMPTGRKPSRVAARLTKAWTNTRRQPVEARRTRTVSASPFRNSLRVANPSVPTPPIISVPFPKMTCGSLKDHPHSPWKHAAKTTTVPPPSAALADKRADYFAAGTLVVWDVDCAAELIHVYRASHPS